MVCLELKDSLNKLSDHACRSAMLHYHSPLLQKIKTWIFMPLFILGMQEQKQTLDIEMFSNFVEDSSSPVTDVYVEMQSKVLEFYTVTLHITAHFTGLRYIMFNYPVTSAMIGVGTNLMMILLICVLIWYHWNDTEWIDEVKDKFKSIKESTTESSLIQDDDDLFMHDMDVVSSSNIRKRLAKLDEE